MNWTELDHDEFSLIMVPLQWTGLNWIEVWIILGFTCFCLKAAMKNYVYEVSFFNCNHFKLN